MKRVFSSKQKRKQAEDDIIRNMARVKKNLKDYRQAETVDVDKTKVMSVLTNFLKLKKDTKIH